MSELIMTLYTGDEGWNEAGYFRMAEQSHHTKSRFQQIPGVVVRRPKVACSIETAGVGDVGDAGDVDPALAVISNTSSQGVSQFPELLGATEKREYLVGPAELLV